MTGGDDRSSVSMEEGSHRSSIVAFRLTSELQEECLVKSSYRHPSSVFASILIRKLRRDYLEGTRYRHPFSVFASILIVVIFLTSFNLSAQEKYDIGFFAGTSYYMGDLNPSVHYAAPSFAAGPICRYNFNDRSSVRGHAFYHSLSGSDPLYAGYIPPGSSKVFDANFVDLGLNFEFNWGPYRTANRRTLASPYVFAGLGYGLKLFGSFGTSSHVTVPFGFGYKMNVGRWLSAGLEAGARKALSDRVDGITNPPFEDGIVPFGNNDWYFFTGVFVTYKIFKFWEECPAYD
jgi:hypothetical protein